MSLDKSPSHKNYKNYVAGKEPLKNAVIIQPDDKINDYIHKNTSHRFWVKDYNKFKNSMMEDSAAMGLAPGEGNPIAPTPNSLGSGDKFPSLDKGKVKKKKKGINESYGDAIENFEYPLTHSDIYSINEPDEFGDIYELKANIIYKAEIEHNRFGIEDIIFVVDTILLSWVTFTYAPDDVDGDNPMEEPKHYKIDEPKVKIEKNSLPFYPSDLSVDFHKSNDPKAWTFDVQFGRSGY